MLEDGEVLYVGAAGVALEEYLGYAVYFCYLRLHALPSTSVEGSELFSACSCMASNPSFILTAICCRRGVTSVQRIAGVVHLAGEHFHLLAGRRHGVVLKLIYELLQRLVQLFHHGLRHLGVYVLKVAGELLQTRCGAVCRLACCSVASFRLRLLQACTWPRPRR